MRLALLESSQARGNGPSAARRRRPFNRDNNSGSETGAPARRQSLRLEDRFNVRGDGDGVVWRGDVWRGDVWRGDGGVPSTQEPRQPLLTAR